MVAQELRTKLRDQVTNLESANARAETAERELTQWKEEARRAREERADQSSRLKDQISKLSKANEELTQAVASLEARLEQSEAALSKEKQAAKPSLSADTLDEMKQMLDSLRAAALDTEEAAAGEAAAEKAAEERMAEERAAAELAASQRAKARLDAEEKEAAEAAEREKREEAERLARVAAAVRERLAAERAAKEKEAEARAAEVEALAMTKQAREQAATQKAAAVAAAEQAMAEQMKTEQAARATTVADAPTFPIGTMEFFEAEAANEHGRDPRYAPPWITENAALLEELASSSTAEPKRATMSSLESITNIQQLEQLETALAKGSADGRLVVVKFYAPWCRTCFQASHSKRRSSRHEGTRRTRYLNPPPLHSPCNALDAARNTSDQASLREDRPRLGGCSCRLLRGRCGRVARPLRISEHREAARRSRVQERRSH